MKKKNQINLGKRVWFGSLKNIDKKRNSKQELINAGLLYYTNFDQEFLAAKEDEKGWFKLCTSRHISTYINQILAQIN